MNHQVRVLEIAPEAKAADRPRALDGFAVSADTLEEARRATAARREAEGLVVRSLSFLAAGGLVAVVHPSTAPTKGGR
ncbi:MAG: hypothetical protein HY901_36960 [Deltaproteobacteria bacterium]|nr:hypothetical protein [Deltaproteobacteria bacterium]